MGALPASASTCRVQLRKPTPAATYNGSEDTPIKRRPTHAILLSALAIITHLAAAGQQPSAAHSFEVVSIRQGTSNPPPRGPGAYEDETTPDGWRLNDASLFIAILKAYVPSKADSPFFHPDQVQGLPDWARNKPYHIDARVAEADLPAWRNPATQPALFHAMMQTMLADRCHLAVHLEQKEQAVYSLQVVKSGIKFKLSDPTAPHPHGYPIPGGGEFLQSDSAGLMHFYDVPAAAVALVLSNVAGRPVVDDTGLTGRYDLALQRPRMSNPSQGVSASDSDDSLSIFSIVGDLGLKLVSAKRSVETPVIDHIEPPSEN